jgi:hypothetical protein
VNRDKKEIVVFQKRSKFERVTPGAKFQEVCDYAEAKKNAKSRGSGLHREIRTSSKKILSEKKH